MAELWAMLEGTKFAIGKGYNRIELHSDNKNIVAKNNGLNRQSGATNGRLRSIKVLIAEDIVVKSTHIFCDPNRCADVVAKMSYIHDHGPHLFRDCPDVMSSLLPKDSFGEASSHVSFL